jgi:hypothetical protein
MKVVRMVEMMENEWAALRAKHWVGLLVEQMVVWLAAMWVVS